MPIRVCQMITELRPAGAERCVYELATRLPRPEFRVEVLALRGGAVADALAATGVPVHVLGVGSRPGIVARLPRLVRILRRGRFDVVHTHLFHADLVGRPAARLAGVPRLVHSVHVAERRRRPWQFAWARVAGGWCDRIVTVSEGVRAFHARRSGLPVDRYEVIHNGIDLSLYARDARRRAALRQEWALREDDLLCAFVGRLDAQKGIAELLDGFALAAGRAPGLRLVLAGDGPLRAFAEQRATRADLAGRVRRLGYVPDPAGVLSAADVFLQPSRWEGFCLAAAEAMAAGLPVVGSDVAGLNEVVANGETGLLVPPADPAALAGAVVRLAGDAALRAALGRAGLRRVRERFDVERFVARHAALYRRRTPA